MQNKEKMIRYEKTTGKRYSNIKQEARHRKYYKRNAHTNFDLNCDTKFMDRLFCQLFRDHFAAHAIYRMNFNMYKIHQFMFLVNTSLIIELTEGNKIIK